MFRALALLQITRAALAFTAVADAWTVVLLRLRGPDGLPPPLSPHEFRILIGKMAIVGVVSFCLYAFGMALNDLLDARHDRVFAPRRPIPSGRLNTRSVVVLCLLLIMAALFASAMLSAFPTSGPSQAAGFPWPLLFCLATAMLIVFYDATSKYLGGLGLVTLGAIRALHCLIGNPKTDFLFLSMFLLTHVIVISTIAYVLENKRPRLRRMDYAFVVLGILVGNSLAVWRMNDHGVLDRDIWPMLWGPMAAMVVFALWATFLLLSRRLTPKQKGERLMLMGLFWLFVYDASMLLSNGQYPSALAVLLLMLCAVGSFYGIRHLSRTMGTPKLDYRAAGPEDVPGGRQGG